MSKMVKSVAMFAVMLLMLAFPAGVWAHSKLESSIPPANSTAKEAVEQLSLTFNEKIDPTLSTVTITNDKGEKVDSAEVKVEGEALVAKLSQPLVTGSYSVEWKIVGKDGHPVKGTYSFQVEAPEKAPAAASGEKENGDKDAPDKKDNQSAAPSDRDKEAGAPSSEQNKTTDPDNGSSAPAQQSKPAPESNAEGNVNWIWIALVVAVAVIGVFLVFKQSRKRR